MKAKKLLAVLLTLTMLVGLVPVAGLLTSAAETPAKMYELKMANGESVRMHKDTSTASSYVSISKGKNYTLSFEYYLGGDAKYEVNDAQQNNTLSNKALSAGRNTFTSTVTALSAAGGASATVVVMTPIIKATSDTTDSKLYVWNVSLVEEGKTENLLASMAWYVRASNVNSLATDEAVEMDYDEALLGGAAAPKMYQIKLEKDTAVRVHKADSTYPTITKGKTYTFSFEYFLSDESATYEVSDAYGNTRWSKENLKAGRNTFTKAVTVEAFDSTPVVPHIKAISTMADVELYVWNVSFVENGTTTNIYADMAWYMRANNVNSLAPDNAVEMDYDESLFVGDDGEGEGSGEGEGDGSGEAGPVQMYKIPFENDGEVVSVGPEAFGSGKRKVSLEKGVAYTLSFDYYLKAGDDTKIGLTGGNGWLANHAIFNSICQLENGTKHFEKILNAADADPAAALIKFTALTVGADDVLYIWNMSLVAAGSTTNLLADAPWAFTDVNNVTAAEFISGVDYDESIVGKVEEGEKENEDGNVIRFNFDKYDWADNDYTNPRVSGDLQTGIKPAEGDKVTIEFEYCLPWEGYLVAFSPYSAWDMHADNPGFVFSDKPEESAYYYLYGPKKDKVKFEFTADADDASRNILLYFQSSYDYEGEVMPLYLWNIKITVNDTVKELDYKTLKANGSGFDWAEVLDIDPATIELGKPAEGDDGDDDNNDDSADADDGEDVGGDGNADDEGDSPDTGDTVTGVVMASVVLALAAATLMISKKRKA